MESNDDLTLNLADYPSKICPSLLAPPASGLEDEGSTIVLTEEDSLVDVIRSAAEILESIASCRRPAVCEMRTDGYRRLTIACHAKLTLRSVCAVLRRDWGDLKHHFPSHSFIPYVEAMTYTLEREPELRECCPDSDRADAASKVNRFANALRAITSTPAFRDAMRACKDRCRVNTAELNRYIDWVFSTQGSKHLAIRLDLRYSMGDRFFTGVPTNITRAQALRDFRRFKRWVADNYPLTGYAWRLEYGLVCGHHFHALFLLNGHEVWNGVRIGCNFGRQWDGVSTDGLGRHHNCNTGSYVRNGIGLIHRSDSVKLKMLKDAAAIYLTKPDLWLRVENQKCFGKGQMPEQWRPPISLGCKTGSLD
jgi:hypothetical protein